MGNVDQPAAQAAHPVTGTAQACDCGADPLAALQTMLVDLTQGPQMRRWLGPLARLAFAKPYGAAHALFTVAPALPAELRVGVFGGASFPAWVRFSGDLYPGDPPDFNPPLGIAIKLFGVPGRKLPPGEADAATHDFLLQNHDVFFVDTAQELCELTHAGAVQGDPGIYLRAHPAVQERLDAMAKQAPGLLQSAYWSIIPFAFGTDRYVKYKLAPSAVPDRPPSARIAPDNPARLQVDLKQRLLNGAAEFQFYLQFQAGAAQMPLDAATVRWDETISVPIPVATLTIFQQNIDAPGQAAYGDNLAFAPWHALPEHAPVGSLAAARRVVYQAAAERRRHVNGIPVGEPVMPRPLRITEAPPP